MSRADRVARRPRRARPRRLARPRPGQPPLPHGLRRQATAVAVVGPARAPLRHGLPLRGAGAEGEVADFDVERGERELLATLRQGWPDGARCGSASRTTTCPCARHCRSARGAAGTHVELVPAGGIVEAVRAVKEPAEVAAIGAAAQLADEAVRRLAEGRAIGRPGARGRHLARAGAAPPGGGGGRLRAHRRLGRARRAQPHAEPQDVAIPAGHPRHDRLRGAPGRLLLRLHADWSTGPPGAELLEAYDVCLRAQRAALAAVRPGMTGKGGRRGGA